MCVQLWETIGAEYACTFSMVHKKALCCGNNSFDQIIPITFFKISYFCPDHCVVYPKLVFKSHEADYLKQIVAPGHIMLLLLVNDGLAFSITLDKIHLSRHASK